MAEANSSANGASSGAAQPWPSPWQAWYGVSVFAIALMFLFLDRGIVALLIQPIKEDWKLTDTQVGLLVGFAFALFYVILGLPIARLADSRSRRLIIAVGIVLWSGMTAACGLAQNFWQLFLARVGVGVGEACNGPPVYSMMSDYFPKEKLARAASILNFGFVFGAGLSLIGGGAAIQMVSSWPELTLPVVGKLRHWQLVFFIVGLPGLLVALLMATVLEPKRRGLLYSRAGGAAHVRSSLPVKQVLGFMWANRATYRPLFLGLGCSSVLFFGNQAWGAAFFQRTYGWGPAKYGLIQGLTLVIVSPIGLMTGGLLSEWYARRGYDDANLRVLRLSNILLLPPTILFPLMPTPQLAVICFGLTSFFALMGAGPQNAALQIITPNEMRAQVTALWLFMFNVLGFGLGPSIVAFFTDYVFGDEAQLRYSMSIVAALLGPIAAVLVWTAVRPYGESVARARTWQ